MSPVELVKKYNDENYDIISITDHDNIKAFQEAKIAGEALNITVVPGVELSTEHTLTLEADADAQHPAGSEVSVELHLLGYQFDPQNEALVRRLAELEENRKARNEQLAAVLTAMGYPVDLQALAAASKGGYVGKPHIARAWVAQGLIAQLKDAWEPGKRLESPEVKAIRKKDGNDRSHRPAAAGGRYGGARASGQAPRSGRTGVRGVLDQSYRSAAGTEKGGTQGSGMFLSGPQRSGGIPFHRACRQAASAYDRGLGFSWRGIKALRFQGSLQRKYLPLREANERGVVVLR